MIEYEVYDTHKNRLNLSLCKDTKINIFLPSNIDGNEIFKYNSSSEYYNDICFIYTTNSNTDITLNDRKSEYNKNMSLCESNCIFNGYDNYTKKSECKCDIKTELTLVSEIKINKDSFLIDLFDINNLINLKILKCYALLFNKDRIIFNICFFIILSIIITLLYIERFSI